MNALQLSDEDHQALLEIYFFRFIDDGFAPEETPLFTGSFEGRDLGELIEARFALPENAVAAVIEAARNEVEL